MIDKVNARRFTLAGRATRRGVGWPGGDARSANRLVKVRQKLGKYRIDRRLAEGGFAAVYKAYDSVAGVFVALKVPHESFATKAMLDDFRKEVRLAAQLDHPNVLPIKDAGFVDGVFVIASPLGTESLADRLQRRISIRTLVSYADQVLEAVAYAHKRRIMHCDIKPENLILFEADRLRLADFGIARVALRTLQASGSGTVGYIAPEQAMGKPSMRSDVFSLGLMLYRMFSGQLPEWPFRWPLPGLERLRARLHPDAVRFLRRALDVDHRKRYADAARMLAAYRRVRRHLLRSAPKSAKRRRPTRSVRHDDWKTVQRRAFIRRYGRALEVHGTCHRCSGPVAETMQICPWCGAKRRVPRDEHRFKAACPRCKRSLKTDWRFCPWCYGAAVNPDSLFRHPDYRYAGRCPNSACHGRQLMPFMRYCPWCRRKVQRRWTIEGSKDRCPRCGWGVVLEHWSFCPWCGKRLNRR